MHGGGKQAARPPPCAVAIEMTALSSHRGEIGGDASHPALPVGADVLETTPSAASTTTAGSASFSGSTAGPSSQSCLASEHPESVEADLDAASAGAAAEASSDEEATEQKDESGKRKSARRRQRRSPAAAELEAGPSSSLSPPATPSAVEFTDC